MTTRIVAAACAVLVALAIAGCGGDEAATAPPPAPEPTAKTEGPTSTADGKFRREPSPIQLYQSASSGNRVDKPVAVAIKNDAILEKWVDGEFSREPKKRTYIAADFGDNRQVWAVFLPKSPRGTRVAITGAATNGETTRLYVTKLLPEKDCPPNQAPASYPSAYVETRTMPARAKLKITTVRQGC